MFDFFWAVLHLVSKQFNVPNIPKKSDCVEQLSIKP